MIKDKYDLIYTLTIRPEFQVLIPLVAKMNGWNGEGDPKVHLNDFLNSYIKGRIKEVINASLIGYYGVSQAELISAALTAYEDSAIVSSEWTTIEEE